MTQTSTPKHPPAILVAVDFSSVSDDALAEAVAQAARIRDAQLHIVHVAHAHGMQAVRLDAPDRDSSATMEVAFGELREHVDAKLAKLDPGQMGHAITHLRVGVPAIEITRLAVQLEVDLVVIGTHGRRGLSRLARGSVAEQVLRLAHSPVLVVRPKSYHEELSAPEIEPPCPECVAARKKTGGAQLWCELHAKPHDRPHVYDSARLPGSRSSSFLIKP